jgi:hypothetical protein
VTVIARERFRKPFAQLSKKHKNEVKSIQMQQHRWRNHASSGRVYSTVCFKEVTVPASSSPATPCTKCHALLSEAAFKKALKIPLPTEENCRYINKQYLNPAAVQLYGRVTGLRELLETASKVPLCPILAYCINSFFSV